MYRQQTFLMIAERIHMTYTTFYVAKDILLLL